MIGAQITIRDARQQDSPAIARILHALDWFEQFRSMSLEQTQARIAERMTLSAREGSNTILVAELAQGVAGYVAIHWYPNLALGYDGYISELFVLPDARGQGIGTRLLAAVDAEARERGCMRLVLMNRRVRESYQRGFYTKHGWQEMPDAAFFTRKLA